MCVNYLNKLMFVSLLMIVSLHNGRSHLLIMFIHQFLWPLPLVITLWLPFMIVLKQKFLTSLCAHTDVFFRIVYAQAAKLRVALLCQFASFVPLQNKNVL